MRSGKTVAMRAGMVLLAVFYLPVIVSFAFAQAKPSSVAGLAAYRGADREEMLKAGAKKEGKVLWYTTLIAYKEIAGVFESKYPGVRVEAYRTGSTELLKRFLSEAQARRHLADVIETTPPSLMAARDHKLITPYFSPHLKLYPDDAKEEADKEKVFWTTDRESIIGLGYNKKFIRAVDVPKNFGDLMKPELKGKMGISGDATGPRIIGAMIRLKGEEFVRQLKNQEMRLYMVSGGALHELLAAGEVAMSPSIFRNHVLTGQEKGAPTEWVPLELVVSNAGGAALPAHTNNPHAALLFIDFLISPEGQKILEEKFRFASSIKNYGFKRWYPEKGLTTDQYEKSFNRWQKIVREIARR
ncbi:MAG: extracellular solute-binding protein [Deltaproteobacteria bacterium]|nr:extracellular solute-binding protein [Deltaproteobacteria bacterium]